MTIMTLCAHFRCHEICSSLQSKGAPVRSKNGMGQALSYVRLLLISIMLVPVAAVAGQLEDGNEALKSGDFQTAYRLLRPLADQGDALAQIGMGAMYAEGQGLERDYKEAARWFGLAAEQKVARAQFI